MIDSLAPLRPSNSALGLLELSPFHKHGMKGCVVERVDARWSFQYDRNLDIVNPQNVDSQKVVVVGGSRFLGSRIPDGTRSTASTSLSTAWTRTHSKQNETRRTSTGFQNTSSLGFISQHKLTPLNFD